MNSFEFVGIRSAGLLFSSLLTLHLLLAYFSSFVYLLRSPEELNRIMSFKNAVVTGANRGLGLEICKQLLEKPEYERVYAICRSAGPDLKALEKNEKLHIIDNIQVMDHADTATRLKDSFQSTQSEPIPIHLLIHNAGAYGPSEGFSSFNEERHSQGIETITPERFRFAFELNTAAPLFVTQALLPNLRAAAPEAKVAIISSAMGSISNNTSGEHYAYRASKAAVNMVGKGLAVDLSKEQIAVGLIHPGFVFTGFGNIKERLEGQRNVDESTKGVLDAVDCIDLNNTGSFLHGNYGEGVKPMEW
jgi:tubulin alpha